MAETKAKYRHDIMPIGTFVGVTIFSLSFITILIYFGAVDVYDRDFFAPGVTLGYNLARVGFAVYTFAMITGPGAAVLSRIGGPSFAGMPALTRLAASFFCGAALWHAVLLLFGFLDLYTYPVAVAVSVPAVALSAVWLRRIVGDCVAGARTLSPIALPFAVITLVAAALLLIVKGLPPAGGHDYFNHYHGYYEAVLRHRGLWPNEAWYQFYYSKGMGLFFLGALLTDPLAPSLVTYCFAIAVALALFQLVDRMTVAPTCWPWIAVIAFLGFYTYTPGIGIYRSNGGWGDFQKPHEIGAAFVIGFLWLSAGLFNAGGRERRIWLAAASGCIAIAAFVELVTVLVLGLLTMALTGLALATRRWDRAAAFLILGVAGGSGLVAVLALNYGMTGLPDDAFLAAIWPWARLQPLIRWGVLPEVVVLARGQIALQAHSGPRTTWQFVEFLRDALRLDLLRPLLLSGFLFPALLAITAAFRASRPSNQDGANQDGANQDGANQDAAPLLVVIALLGVVAVAAASAGTGQPLSFYRYASFALPLVIAFAACGWQFITAPVRHPWLGAGLRFALPVVLLAVAFGQFWRAEGQSLRLVVPAALGFAGGSVSIRDAYANQQGWPGRMPWGGIFPGMVGAWQAAGPGARIRSLHLWSYCLLPHCRAETWFSFILSPRLLDVVAGPPETARDILRGEGLDYFFFTTAMPIADILPTTPLFLPDRIASFLGIKWTDGTSYLLTWLGPGVTPLTPEWLARYGEAVAASLKPLGERPLLLDLRELLLDLRERLRGPPPRWGGDLTIPGITAPASPR